VRGKSGDKRMNLGGHGAYERPRNREGRTAERRGDSTGVCRVNACRERALCSMARVFCALVAFSLLLFPLWHLYVSATVVHRARASRIAPRPRHPIISLTRASLVEVTSHNAAQV